jgi:histidinol-phosphate aminotransferase
VDLRLDGNEGSHPPADLLDVVVRGGTPMLRQYPDATSCERLVGERMGVEPERVIVTAGGDDAIERIVRAVMEDGREMVLPVPTFEMFERYAALAGGSIVRVPWTRDPFPVEDVVEASTERTALVVVVSPNSPTGLAAGRDDVARVARDVPQALVLVDLAYVEFADDDVTDVALARENVVVVRSMSKAWGMAGLRVGWAAGPAEVVGWLRAAGHPYAVSSVSLALAEARLRTGRRQVSRFAVRVREERRAFGDLVRGLGGSALPSQANFVLARFEDAGWVRDALAGMGIAVRIFPGKEHLEGCLRVTMPGDAALYDRLARAVATVRAPRAIVVGASCPREPEAVRALGAAATRSGASLAWIGGEVAGRAGARGAREEAGWEAVSSTRDAELTAELGRARGGVWVACGSSREVRAAREASALPLAVTGDGEEGRERGERLVRAGAGRALGSLEDVAALLPER